MKVLAPNTRLIRLFVNLFLARFSPADIEKATRHPLRIALCGAPEAIWDFRDMLTGGTVSRDEPFPSLTMHPLPTDDPANHWRLVDDCQMAVVLLQREHLLGDTMYRIHETLPKKVAAVWASVGHIEPWLRYEVTEICRELSIGPFVFVEDFTPHGTRVLQTEIIKYGGGYDLAMARKMPLLRDVTASRLVRKTARHNLMIAMASALPASIPWIGPIIGMLGVTGEIIFITSSQLRMVLQIASIYGMDMNVTERISELLPVIGSAFGWRAISRELVGFIPAIGPGVKGSIAYAGTVATGEAARWYYQTGHHLEPSERSKVFNEAFERAGDLVRQAMALLGGMGDRDRKKFAETLVSDQAALPEWNGEKDVTDKPIQEASQPPVSGFRLDSREDEGQVGSVDQRPRKKRKKKDEV